MTSKQRQKHPSLKQEPFNPSSRKTKAYNDRDYRKGCTSIHPSSINCNDTSLTITNQKNPKQKSAYQLLYGGRQRHSSTRMVGSMLSRLSKSDKKRVDDLQKETERKRREKQNKRMNQFRQSRIEEIQSMRQTYLQKSKWDRQRDERTNNINQKETDKSLDQGIPSFKKVRPVSGLDNWNNTPSVQPIQARPEVQNSNDDTSMRELIDWLENVDLTGIDDFI